LAAVRSAEERSQARNGTYEATIANLDISFATPKYFTVGTVSPGSTSSLEDSWTLTLTRVGASSGYGAYTVIFTQDGYDATNSTIQAIPDINPLGQ
jgi:type IV pilus assembly protein PilA